MEQGLVVVVVAGRVVVVVGGALVVVVVGCAVDVVACAVVAVVPLGPVGPVAPVFPVAPVAPVLPWATFLYAFFTASSMRAWSTPFSWLMMSSTRTAGVLPASNAAVSADNVCVRMSVSLSTTVWLTTVSLSICACRILML